MTHPCMGRLTEIVVTYRNYNCVVTKSLTRHYARVIIRSGPGTNYPHMVTFSPSGKCWDTSELVTTTSFHILPHSKFTIKLSYNIIS
jgi:hypothetical protein